MRIIAGALKGRRLDAPAWDGLRPTSDKLRETLFNILGARIDGARVLDAYAGTGAVGIEAISRGAAHVTFVERDARAIDLMVRNLERCGVLRAYAIIRADLGGGAPGPLAAAYDVVFLDPPYDANPGEAVAAVEAALAPDGLLILEHARRRTAPESTARLDRYRAVNSGDSALAFYRHRRPVPAADCP
jgi:16S rRNA (guanine966-N2)-methyltransferase